MRETVVLIPWRGGWSNRDDALPRMAQAVIDTARGWSSAQRKAADPHPDTFGPETAPRKA